MAPSCSCERRGSASGWSRTAKTAAVMIAVDRRLVELVDEVEVVEALDVGAAEAGLLGELAQGAQRDPLARLERARHALPQAGQDPPGSAADEQDLRPRDVARRRPTRNIQQSTRSGRKGLTCAA